MHIRLLDRQNVPFLATSLSLRKKFSKFVCGFFFCCYFVFVFHNIVWLLAPTSLWLLISFRVTLSQVVSQGFLAVDLFQYFSSSYCTCNRCTISNNKFSLLATILLDTCLLLCHFSFIAKGIKQDGLLIHFHKIIIKNIKV